MKTMKNISPSYQSHYHNNHQSSKMKVKAVYKTSKSKALGEDESPMQLIKYAPKSTKDEIGQICNNVFLAISKEINIGKSGMLPIPKPRKEESPLKGVMHRFCG